MKRRQRKPHQIEVPVRLADPAVEDFVEPHEVRSLSEAQALAADRHTAEWSGWYADQRTTTVEVPVVSDRAMLGTSQVDAVVEMTAPNLVGISVEQTRRLLLGEPFRFRDKAGFERGIPS